MRPRRDRASELILTCEHGGNRVPAAYRSLFRSGSARRALASHRGFDPGARALAEAMARQTGAPLHLASVSRLLVELNRSIGHPRLLSEFSGTLDDEARRLLLARYYHPYRDGVARAVEAGVRRGRTVLHLSIHSFSPAWGGRDRGIDLGLLYDPSRSGERCLCARWRDALRRLAPALRVRRNAPYRGVSDGLVTALRRRFGPGQYLGVELEVSQHLAAGDRRRPGLAGLLVGGLEASWRAQRARL